MPIFCLCGYHPCCFPPKDRRTPTQVYLEEHQAASEQKRVGDSEREVDCVRKLMLWIDSGLDGNTGPTPTQVDLGIYKRKGERLGVMKTSIVGVDKWASGDEWGSEIELRLSKERELRGSVEGAAGVDSAQGESKTQEFTVGEDKAQPALPAPEGVQAAVEAPKEQEKPKFYRDTTPEEMQVPQGSINRVPQSEAESRCCGP